MNSTQFLKIIDAVDEGILIVDQQGIIQMFNKRARLMTGVDIRPVMPHESGKINSGDLVIIADNRLGYDDGELDIAQLKKIGIKTDELKRDDAFVAVGLYDTPEKTGALKIWKNKSQRDHLTFETIFENHKVYVSINLKDKVLEIRIDGVPYLMHYAIAIGHIVVYDLQSNCVKFYQDKGYSVRNETVSELLNGTAFRSKMQNYGGTDNRQPATNGVEFVEDVKVIGEQISTILHSELLLSMTNRCQSSETEKIEYTYVEINQRPILCAAEKLKETKLVMVKMIDLSDAYALIEQRNQLISTLEKATQQLHLSKERTKASASTKIIGNSNAIQRINFLIEKAAKSQSTVLITGESGTGKTLIAEEIHKSGHESGKSPFVSVNCTAIPHQLFESELFGYVKGAFTGAEKGGKIGLFQMADGGTLFLDEIGELPQKMQVKLLQVLQSKSFYKVGATSPTRVDVRIIAATNKDLRAEIESRNFREDLYYRLGAFPLYVAPLRERKGDLYPLIEALLKKFAVSLDMEPKVLSGEAMAMLLDYHWPGNIRELENVIELAYNLSEGKKIEAEDIVLSVPMRTKPLPQTLKSVTEEAERQQMIKVLDETDHDVKKAIEMLEISRSVFYEKTKKYGVTLRKK